jgi:hypothetical protein
MSILDSQKIINHIPHWLGPTYARVRGWIWVAEDTWRDRRTALADWIRP